MNKTAIITGSLGSLGKATTASFRHRGFRVIGIDRPETLPGAPEITETEEHHGVDLCDIPSTKALLGSIGEAHPSIHAGVMLAGGFSMAHLSETSMEEIRAMLAINFETAFNATQALLPHMAEGGRFIYIGAKPALDPTAGQHMAAYAFSKSLVFQLADMVNEAGREKNISATVIVPSIIDTPANRGAMPDANFADWVRPEEIGKMAAYLCSEEGRAVRESTIKMYANS
ncbi:MAG: SDR family NAD(P)-dependent oxidoreductase [Bacteroidota bacterium]